MMDLSHGFFFENFDVQQIKSDAHLGYELLTGRLFSPLLEKIFPSIQVSFLPLLPSNVNQSFFIQNLGKNNFFKNFDVVFLDWPKFFEPLLVELKSSFPSPICLAPKNLVYEQTSIHESHSKSIYFIESYCSRRHVLFYSDALNVKCLGSEEASLYSYLNSSSFSWPSVFPHGLIPWLQSFLNSKVNVCKEEHHQFFEEFFSHLKSLSSKKVLLACSPKKLIMLEQFLLNFDQKNESKFYQIPFGLKDSYLLTSLPNEQSLDYSAISGFLARKIYENEFSTRLICDWQAELKSYLSELFLLVKESYEDWTKVSLQNYEQRDFFRYAYRLASLKGNWFPDSFDFLVAAKSVINSNFAYEFYEKIKYFPGINSYQSLNIPLSSITQFTEKISLQKFTTLQAQKKFQKPKFLSVPKKTQVLTPFQEPVSEEKYADDSWVHENHPYSCSFPSEDIFMENLAADCARKMKEKLKESEIVSKALEYDLGEGLDMRATLRQWHTHKIIIKEKSHTGKIDIGSVIFSFAAPENEKKYTWKAMWHAEKHDNSHLMFFATPFADHVIGPGIARSEFGGFAVIPVESYLDDPWHHPFICHHARSDCDALLIAAALSSSHRSVLFIGNHAPSDHVLKLIRQCGKNVVVSNLNDYPSAYVRQVRTFHILAEAGVRNYAAKYIKKEYL